MTINLAVLGGTVPADPELRELPGGSVVAQFDVTTRIESDGREANQAVPVAWYDPPSRDLATVIAGVDLVVIGIVRRRFFRVGGATQSRTEVVAATVLPARRRTQVAGALHAAAERLLS